MLLLVIIIITHIRTSQCVRATPGHPVPNADVLDDLLSKYLGDSYSNNALFNFILGEPNQNREPSMSAGDNLDISILDVDSVRKIINFAKQKHENETKTPMKSQRRILDDKGQAYWDWTPYIRNKTFDLMKHAIYMTQEKVNFTRTYRKKYAARPPYQIALLYGAAAAMLSKMESLVANMRQLPHRTHFIWFLVFYEKILATNIDINDTVEKIFKIQEVDEKARGGKKAASSRLNLTSDQLLDFLEDPHAWERYKYEHGVEMLRSRRQQGRN